MEKSQICIGRKKDGSLCTYRAQKPSRYCGIHKPQYELQTIRRIGSGGFGQTTLVRDKSTGKQYLMKKSLRDRPTEIRRQYQNLMAVQQRVDPDTRHLFVAPVGVGQEDRYLLMDYLKDFVPLSYVLCGHLPSTREERRQAALLLLRAVDALHQAGMAHSDIKPENIMVGRDPETKQIQLRLIDFGLACTRENCRKASPGGTIRYMPPSFLDYYDFRPQGTFSLSKRNFEDYVEYDRWATGLVVLSLSYDKTSNPVLDLLSNQPKKHYASILRTHPTVLRDANTRIREFTGYPKDLLVSS